MAQRVEGSASARAHSAWGVAAGVVLAVSGLISLVNGFTALDHESYYGHQIVYDHLAFWGWLFLIWGAAELVAGGMAAAGRYGAISAGIVLAGIEMVLWFCLIFAAPGAAVVGILVNGFVIAGLAVAGADDPVY